MKKLIFITFTLLFCKLAFAQWQVISEMPIPVSGAKAIIQDTVIYIIGGSDHGAIRTGTQRIQAYYPNSNSWKVLKDSLLVPREGMSVETYHDSVYIFGGATTTDSNSTYSIEQWGYHDNSKIKGYNSNFNRSATATAMVDNYLFIFGGYPNWEVYDSLSYLVRFNMLNANVVDSFAINDSFSVDLPTHQMSAVVENKVYIFGGIFNSILRSISYFDLATYKWVELNKTLSEPQAGGVAISDPDDEQILLIGGRNEISQALNTVLEFNISDNTLHNKAPLNVPRSEHTAVLYQDSIIYVFGGKNDDEEIVSAVEMVKLPLEDMAVSVYLDVERPFIKKDFELLGNYPNPFNPLTTIKFTVNRQSHITVNIFNIQGEKIKTLYNNLLLPGNHSFIWDATNDLHQAVASGIYFYTISSGKLAETKRMLLIR